LRQRRDTDGRESLAQEDGGQGALNRPGWFRGSARPECTAESHRRKEWDKAHSIGLGVARRKRDGKGKPGESQSRNCRRTRVEKVPEAIRDDRRSSNLECSTAMGAWRRKVGGQGALSEPGALRGSV